MSARVADVDDPPAAAAHHARGGLGAEERAPQVQVEVAVEGRLRRGREGRALEARRVVDEHVQTAERPPRLRDEPPRRGGVGEVGAEGDAARAERPQAAHDDPRRARGPPWPSS